MNILFVTGHPAQIHNFRLVREILIKNGHNIFWLTTPKDISTNLLNIYGISYDLLVKPSKSLVGRAVALFKNTLKVFKFIRKNKIDVCVTRTDPYTALAAWLLSVPNIMLQDTEIAANSKLQGPFAKFGTTYLVPDCFSIVKRKDEIRFNGNIELFYCHPNRFHFKEPYSILGIGKNEKYAVVRFVKWDAFHDQGLCGGFTLQQKRKLVSALSKCVRVFISSEDILPDDLAVYKISIPLERVHDVLCGASLFVGESATMASESVVLGTPAIYVDEVGRGYTDEEAREGLLWMFRPVNNKDSLSPSESSWISGGIEECIAKAVEILSDSFDYNEWKLKYNQWINNKIDCTSWLTWVIENYPESLEQWKRSRGTFDVNLKES